ncbi:hypothetical protein H072_2803 [Dactylellina haptotyla CBS 200.50]|uniref:Uncharacterized protein n=1 Tax=Dactylellina haptotyla (strain CBS 200.50) TaxID=1284197 RepID=S8AJT8_DACHA|nr:hypothetical protein H072_2803 [Dactylellina haptotyla CBS 200.50]
MATDLFNALDRRPFDALIQDGDIYDNSILYTRSYLDALNKQAVVNDRLHLTGFDVDQIWEQTKRFLDKISNAAPLAPTNIPNIGTTKPLFKKARVDRVVEDKLDQSFNRQSDDESHIPSTAIKISDAKYIGELNSDGGDDLSEIKLLETSRTCDDKAIRLVTHRNYQPSDQLDDDFFSLEKFNSETERFERADELGRQLGELDQVINWHADFEEQTDRLDYSSADDTSESGEKQHGLMYTDFFLPPDDLREPLVESHTSPPPGLSPTPPPTGLKTERHDFVDILEGIQNDLFAEPLMDRSREDNNADRHSSESLTKRTVYRQSQAQLNDLIRSLEQQNIDRKEWTLSGETDSQKRPFNSLLQEDLDFERVGKPVPVFTRDITIKLEDMVKTRILSGSFDGVTRRNPEARGGSRRAALVELDDSKSRIGLAELYEKEHQAKIVMQRQSHNRDAKLSILKTEITELISTVDEQLNRLSSWRFVPKAPRSVLSVLHDTRVLEIEEANINSGNLSVANSSSLAPQEIYHPSFTEYLSSGVTKLSGTPVSNNEMERDQRTRDRRRRKREKRPLISRETKNPDTKEKGLLNALQQGNVSIINKDGQRTSISRKHGEENVISTVYVKL